MPFTPTHIAAVLPLVGLTRRMPFTALAIGAMTPDFPLFVPYASSGYYAMHSWPGVVSNCLPVGMAGFLCFQVFLKDPLFRLYPAWVQARTGRWRISCVEPNVWFFVGVSLAIMLGAGSHLVWDSFTHEGRWGTRLFPSLNEVWIRYRGVTVQGCRLLQHGSTVVGLPALAIGAWFWMRRQPLCDVPPPTAPATAKLAACLTLGLLALLTTLIVVWEGEPGIGWKLNRWVTQFGFLLLVSVPSYAIVFHAYDSRVP